MTQASRSRFSNPTSAGEPAEAEPEIVRLADELVGKAKQTGARITFIEDAELLADYGGVAALLRFKSDTACPARSLRSTRPAGDGAPVALRTSVERDCRYDRSDDRRWPPSLRRSR